MGASQGADFGHVALRKESVDRNNLHCVEEVSGDTWARGSRVTYVEKVPADVYYQANAVDQILPGHEYNIVHNRFGRPIDVQLIK